MNNQESKKIYPQVLGGEIVAVMPPSSSRAIAYRGHKITETIEMGWSDSQQGMVENGFRVVVEGPHYSLNKQLYGGIGRDIYRAIDRAIEKAGAA